MANELVKASQEKAIGKMTLAEIADELYQRLRRLGNDPRNNSIINDHSKRYYDAAAYATSRHVMLRYFNYQVDISVTKKQAGQYLRWLRTGNIGTHIDALRSIEADHA